MYSLDVNASPAIQPHLDLVMPATAQTVMEIISGVFAIFGICYLVREAIKTKSYYPIMFFLGAGLGFLSEPFVDVGLTCIYPHVGQHVAVELVGRKMPLFVLFCYFGTLPPFFAMAGNYMEKGVDSKVIWLAFVVMGAGTALVEILAIHFGLWSYYGEHRLRILGYPLFIVFENGVAYLLSAVAYMKFKPIFTGNKQILGILIIPIVFKMGEFGVGWPMWSVVNTARAVESDLLVYAGMLGTLVFAVAVVWCVCYAIAVPKTRTE